MFWTKRKKESIYESLVKQHDEYLKGSRQALESGNLEARQNADQIVKMTYLAWALDAVDELRAKGYELDFSIDSIKVIDDYLNYLHDGIVAERPSEQLIIEKAKVYAGYVGTVLVLQSSSLHWSIASHDLTDYSAVILTDGENQWHIVKEAYEQLVNGKEYSLWLLANSIMNKF